MSTCGRTCFQPWCNFILLFFTACLLLIFIRTVFLRYLLVIWRHILILWRKWYNLWWLVRLLFNLPLLLGLGFFFAHLLASKDLRAFGFYLNLTFGLLLLYCAIVIVLLLICLLIMIIIWRAYLLGRRWWYWCLILLLSRSIITVQIITCGCSGSCVLLVIIWIALI